MPQCCAFNCFTQQQKGVLLHRIPSETNDAARRAVWISRIRRANWDPGLNSRLCEKHFEPSQYEQKRADGIRKLKPNAVPTIFDYGPKQRAPKKSRAPKNVSDDAPMPKEEAAKSSSDGVTTFQPIAAASQTVMNPFSGGIKTLKSIQVPIIFGYVNAPQAPDQKSNISVSASQQAVNPCSDSAKKLQPVTIPVLLSYGSQPSPTELPDAKNGECSADTPLTSEDEISEFNFRVTASAAGPGDDAFAEERRVYIRKLKALQRSNRKLQLEKQELESKIKVIFHEDQLKCLASRNMRGIPWTEKTLHTALRLRRVCGCNGYATLRELGYPLPCERTLQRLLKTI